MIPKKRHTADTPESLLPFGAKSNLYAIHFRIDFTNDHDENSYREVFETCFCPPFLALLLLLLFFFFFSVSLNTRDNK